MPTPPPHAPKTKHGLGNKISNNLVALSSAAVLAVYTAGYLRTSAAAARLEASSSQRRTAAPVHAPAGQSPAPVSMPTTENRPPVVAVPQALPAQEASDRNRQADRRNLDEGRQVAPPPVGTGALTNGGTSSASPMPPAAAPVVSTAPEPVPAAAPVAVDHPVPDAVACDP